MPRLGLVTCDTHPELPDDDRLLLPLLKEAGVEVTSTVWDDPTINWHQFDTLLIRATWDYHSKFPQFLNWLKRLESLQIPVWNPLPLMRQNLVKTYTMKYTYSPSTKRSIIEQISTCDARNNCFKNPLSFTWSSLRQSKFSSKQAKLKQIGIIHFLLCRRPIVFEVSQLL